MKLMGVDVGTTNIKAGLFDYHGSAVKLASRSTPTRQTEEGYYYYDPEELWNTVAAVIQEAAQSAAGEEIVSVGIASMAEAGLLVDRHTGAARSHMIPWFDTRTMEQIEQIKQAGDPLERFAASGLRANFKQGLSKILWLRDRGGVDLQDTKWLSMGDYIAYRLTGRMATDYSLAARTFLYRIDRKCWDESWIRQFGLSPDMFPEALPAGTPLGTVLPEMAAGLGLSKQTTVAIAGHDHVCASLSVGAVTPGIVFDSMGTAETLVGMLSERPLGEAEYATGLSYGCHVVPDRYFWMGGINASGASVEWLRSKLSGSELMSYERMSEMLSHTKQEPSGILYYPYLSGSGAPNPDPQAKAAFIGLTKSHEQGDMLRAVLEGTSYELESIRLKAEQIAGEDIEHLIAVGGGTRNRHWMNIKADVTGCRITVSQVVEATLLGAAITAGIGVGVYKDANEAAASIREEQRNIVEPHAANHAAYKRIFNQGYMPLQAPLRQYYNLHE
ncbi:carbohydrate kinase [Paenibacillus albiflavus]|uniref:Carbohydrate kinase n=1 Tax=Paenibacillus albiflavus TaxID=2545760 RepID=A0A4R4E806_9BACL|nr:FGGY family carbohydrate kinase [Paenibacillus albiflavus]TCZ75896.1 carbohydrate kinase [Paenibacillus albiflavus]